MKWIMQSGGGCGIACLAMLTDLEYNAVRELAPDLCERCGIMTEPHVDHFLASCGYSVQRFFPYKEFDGKVREKWPPKPWAERHICMVIQTKKDHVAHYVCMDSRGLIYDPADIEYRKCRLSRYYDVLWVAGVVKVG